MAHGLIPTPAKRPTPEQLVIPIEAKSFHYHGEASLDGVRCKVRRTPLQAGTMCEYWVDVSQSSAIRRYRVEWNGNTVALTDIDYEQTDQMWLPAQWTNSNYDGKKQLIASKSVTVVDRQLDGVLKKEQFQARSEEGRIVYNAQTDKTYRVRADGSLEDAVLRRSRGVSWWTWGAICLAMAMLALVTIVVRRRKAVIG